MNLLDLPLENLEQILKFLTYDEVAKIRPVCVVMNKVCQNILNRGFLMLMKKHSSKLKEIKGKLPRRESERRNHPLSKHVSILKCIDTRISMLSMAYTKYINLNLCCFIPGKFIDEVLTILRLIETNSEPLRIQDLQELRDISVMAVEHFNDNISNYFKNSFLCSQKSSYSVTSGYYPLKTSVDSPATNANSTTEQTNEKDHNCIEAQKNTIALLDMERKYRNAITKMRQMFYIQKKQLQQMKTNHCQITDLTSQIVELKRRIEELDSKNREIITTTTTTITNTSRKTPEKPKNIKPRAATIILKRIAMPKQFGDIKRVKSNED